MDDPFNLLDKKWIPVIRNNGEPDRVGICEALTDAAQIREIHAASPLDTVALYRFLLAVLQWCKLDDHQLDRDRVRKNGFSCKWFETLEQHKQGFELLADEYGFYQDANAAKELLKTKQEQWDKAQEKKKAKGKRPSPAQNRPASLTDDDYSPATNLIHELPSGSNVAHFRHTRDFQDGLCLACCAIALLRWSAFASAGTKGPYESMTASPNGNAPSYSLPLGINLQETLWLNLSTHARVEGDSPIWDRANQDSPLGVMKGFTWRSRRVLLAPKDSEGRRHLAPGNCCWCGTDSDQLVREIVFRPGWRRPFTKKPWEEDPHLLMRVEEPKAGSSDRRFIPINLPDANDPESAHSSVWRRVYRAMLQSVAATSADKETKEPGQHRHVRECLGKATEFQGLTLACFGAAAAQELYKDGPSLTWHLPDAQVSADVAKMAIDELDWLNGLDLRNILKDALPRQTKKRPEITATLACASVEAEDRLRECFEELVKALASKCPNAKDDWRKKAQKCLADQLSQASNMLRRGSALRRKEQEVAVSTTFREATAKPQRGKGKEVEHESD